jgi:hypothetical protein
LRGDMSLCVLLPPPLNFVLDEAAIRRFVLSPA